MKNKIKKNFAAVVGGIVLIIMIISAINISGGNNASSNRNSAGRVREDSPPSGGANWDSSWDGHVMSSQGGFYMMDSIAEDSVSRRSFDSESEFARVSAEERIITRNRITIETRNIGETAREIYGLVEEFSGKIPSRNIELGNRQRGTINIQIPDYRASQFVTEINEKHNVSAYFTDIRDVTEDYMSAEREIERLERRIQLWREFEAQVTVREVETRIRITDQIFWIQDQIDRIVDRNEEVDRQVRYRDIVITLAAPSRIQGERNFWHNTLQLIVDTAEETVRVIIVIAIISVPILLFVVLPIKIAHKRKNKL